MKKILAIFLMLVLITTSVSAVKITQKKENNEAGKSADYFEECNCINKYHTRPLPPKTKEQLDKMIKDPQPTRSFDSLPNQFSWRNFGGDWTTSVKDQGNCGSCWDFAALGAMEAAIDMSSGDPNTNVDLSEQYVLSCLSAAGNCPNGGWPSEAIEYIKSTEQGDAGNGINGCTIESCFPYEAKDYIPCSEKCSDWDYKSDPIQADNKLFEVEDWGVTSINPTSSSDWHLLKSWVYDYGPIAIDMYASNSYKSWGSSHHSSTDVYEGTETGPYTTHAQVLVGWVDDPDVYNGGYWIIKNSWGTGFGYGGYSNIAYGCLMVGDRDVTWVTTPSWPHGDDDGIPDIDLAVFANFEYKTETGTIYPHPNEEIEFTDTSDGDVVIWEWDFDGDGIIDSTKKNPTWTYTEEGEYEVTLTIKGQGGLDSTRSRTIEIKNNWPPVVEIPEEFVGNSLTYHFDARYCWDPDGTISEFLWDFDDGTTDSNEFTDHTFPEGDKIYEITLNLTDDEGSTAEGICRLKIDQTIPPETEIVHGFCQGLSEWYGGSQRISFVATDWTGVIDTYYRVNGGTWKHFNPDRDDYITINEEGTYTIEAYSVDYYGNEEVPVVDEFGIDKTEPSLDIDISGDFQGDQYIAPVTVSLIGEDDNSGIDNIIYKTRSHSSWVEYTGSFELKESCTLNVVVIDNAGNTYEEDVNIAIEGPPTIPSISGPSRGTPGEEVEFVFKATDYSPSLEDNIYLYIEWGDGEVEDWIGPFDSGEEVVRGHVFSEEKTYTVRAKAKDKLGAESDWGEYHVTMPKAKSMDFPLLQRFFSNFPVLQEILQLIANW